MTSIDPDDSKALLDHINESDTARSSVAADRVTDGLLRAAASAAAADKTDTAAAVLRQVRRIRPELAVVPAPARPERRFHASPVFVRSFATVAASLMVLACLWWVSESLRLQSLATVEAYGQVTIRRGDRTIPVTAATRLYSRDTIETKDGSRATVRYTGERTYLSLRADSRLRLSQSDGAKQLFLDTGTLTADVAPQPADRPMIVSTPRASIRVAGTRFRIQSDAAGALLEVTEGKVCMTRLSDRYSLEVPAGCTLALQGTRTPTLAPIEQVVLGHLRKDQLVEPDKSVRLARAFAINTLTYEVPLDNGAPPDRLKEAVAAAHQAGLRFFARVDLKNGRAMNMNQSEYIKLLQNRLATLVERYDFDGVYFINGIPGKDEAHIVDLLNPVYQYMNETQPGTSLLVGGPNDSST